MDAYWRLGAQGRITGPTGVPTTDHDATRQKQGAGNVEPETEEPKVEEPEKQEEPEILKNLESTDNNDNIYTAYNLVYGINRNR